MWQFFTRVLMLIPGVDGMGLVSGISMTRLMPEANRGRGRRKITGPRPVRLDGLRGLRG
jgi:hypothetical protein